MPIWLRRLMYGIMLLCCVIVGARVYLEMRPAAQSVEPAQLQQFTPDQLPAFTLNDVWGEPRSITEWAGQPLLINFWATWCAPCRREMPLLQALHTEQRHTGLQVLGIAIDRQPDVLSFITEAGIAYPILSGEADAMAVSDLFGLDGLGLPFSVLVASDGQILTVHIGEVDQSQLARMVEISQAVENAAMSADKARAELETLTIPTAP